MLKLRRGKPPFVDVPLGGGASIRVRAATQTDIEEATTRASRDLMGLVAGSEAGTVLAEILGDDFNIDALKDNNRIVAAGSRLSDIHLVLSCQDGWTGIGTQDGEVIAEPDAATLAMLLSDPVHHSRIMAAVNRRVHEEQEEKNASAASPNGEADTQIGARTADVSANHAPSDGLSRATLERGPGARKSNSRRELRKDAPR